MQNRKISVSIMVSIDGYVAGPDPNEYWHNWTEEMDDYMMGFFKTVDAFIYGRKSYEEMLEYWPHQTGEFADIMNQTPKLVFSRTLESLTWNSTRFTELDPEYFRRLKQQPGKDLVIFAGPEVIKAFRKHNLIDEYRLIYNPLVLGGGKPLFESIDSTLHLKFISSKVFNCGNVLMVYEPLKK